MPDIPAACRRVNAKTLCLYLLILLLGRAQLSCSLSVRQWGFPELLWGEWPPASLRESRVFWGSHQDTGCRRKKEPLTNVSLWALDFYFGEGAQVTVPGDLMAPFLNGIIFSSGPKWSDALWGPRCCQTVHKLTRKAVASAFPRPLGAVMFTTPRPPVLTPAATPWPVGAAIRHCSSSTSVKEKKKKKLFRANFYNWTSEKAMVILASDPLIMC